MKAAHLYYTDLGNASLKPETALQYDLGFVIEAPLSSPLRGKSGSHRCIVRRVRLQTDVYYNSVHDKIVAYPKGQQFRWTMLDRKSVV